MYKKNFIFFITLLFPFLIALSKPLPSKTVFVINTNYKGVIDDKTLRMGKGFILIKSSPPKLEGSELILQTKRYNIFATATRKDLMNPAAFKKVLAGKFNKDGTIKIYTLANLGYAKIQLPEDLVETDKIALVNNRGETIPIHEIKISFVSHPLYKPPDS